MSRSKVQKVQSRLEEMGFTLRQSKDRIDCESTLGAYLKLNDAIPEMIGLCEKSGTMLQEVYNNDDFHWVGGTREELTDALNGRIDMSRFIRAKQEFAKTALHKRIQAVMAETGSKRSRRLSEHDGEWDYDRRWEIAPFAATIRKAAPLKILEINAEMSILGGTSAEDVDRYGATIWALSQLVEEAGIQTRIVYEVSLRNLAEPSPGMASLHSKTRLILKDAGQYLSPSLLAAAFSCNFKRRLNFAHSCVLAEAAGRKVNSGLGTPIYRDQPIEFTEGKLLLSLKAAHKGYSAQVEREILKAIGA